eukprot:13595221-Alexandrium_andersonii.AAC.1
MRFLPEALREPTPELEGDALALQRSTLGCLRSVGCRVQPRGGCSSRSASHALSGVASHAFRPELPCKPFPESHPHAFCPEPRCMPTPESESLRM